jgi:hypothetical protein
MKKIKKNHALILLSLLGLCVISCTSKPPEIHRVLHQLNYVLDRETNRISQKLTLFIVPEDTDGMDDLAYLYLIHDEGELFWTLKKESWLTSESIGSLWIGSNSFCMPDDSDMPSGEYRILLMDLGGGTDESSFNLQASNVDRTLLSFPLSEVRDNTIHVTSIYSANEIWIYEADNQFKISLPIGENGISFSSIFSRVPDLSKKFTYYVYTHDKPGELGLIHGPFFP